MGWSSGGKDALKDIARAGLYADVLEILGPTGIIIPMGDTADENGPRTTVTTRGGEQVVFTYSEAVTAFVTPPSTKGAVNIPVITFDGTDEEADSPDAAYWTRIDAVWSIGAWVNLADATGSTMLSKFDTVGNTREWIFWFNASDKLELRIYDEDDAENDSISVIADSAQSEGAWVFVVATVDGASDESGLNVYVDGAAVAQTQADSGDFGSMRDKAGTVKLGFQNATPDNLFDGQMAGGPLALFFTQKELSADEILRLHQLERVALSV